MREILILYFIFINIVGFSIMYVDKQRAINNEWRVKENSLFLIVIIGGSVGSIIGMYLFRHKTKHLKFTLGYPMILILQALSLYKIL